MILIVCVDDDGGMAFNGRRQSRLKIKITKPRMICGNVQMDLRFSLIPATGIFMAFSVIFSASLPNTFFTEFLDGEVGG